MRLKPKTVRRLLLITVAATLAGGALFGLFVVRSWQNQRVTRTLYADAMAARDRGDDFGVVNNLGRYLKRLKRPDEEALRTWADARTRVEEADGKHLRDAIGAYQQYLDARPDDSSARLTLLKLCNQAGYFVEARDTAQRLRPQALDQAGPEHADVLREEAIALVGMRATDDRIDPVLKRLAQLAPLDPTANTVNLQRLAAAQRTPEARAVADALLAAHPGDPSAQLIVGLSRLLDPPDIAAARDALCRAAELDTAEPARTGDTPYPGPDFVRILAGALDQLGMHDHALQVLLHATGPAADMQVNRSLVRRLWQDGRDGEVIARTADLNPASSDTDVELMAFRTLSLRRAGQAPDAVPLAAAITARQGDFRAKSWTLALQSVGVAPAPAPLDAARDLRTALDINPRDPALMVLYGNTLATLGRTDEARRLWQDAAASPVARGWPAPLLRSAESLLEEGRPEDAARVATDALALGPNRISSNALWARAHAARLAAGSTAPPSARDVLSRVAEADEKIRGLPQSEALQTPVEQLLAARVTLLLVLDDPAGARAVIERALRGTLSQSALRELAGLARGAGLENADAIFARAEQAGGMTIPLAYSRAAELAALGRVAEGRALLDAAVAGAPADSPDGPAAVARYLELTGDPAARAAWSALADAFPGDLSVQRLCLQAPSIAAESPLVDRLVARYKALSGADADDATVTIARARALLASKPTRRNRDEAVATLGALVAAQPSNADARLLLVSALTLSDPAQGITPDIPRATSVLNDISALAQRAPELAIEYARLLQARRDFAAAREQLTRVARDAALDTMTRRRAAELLLNQGDAALAVPPLTDMAQSLGPAAPAMLLVKLAEAHLALRQDDQAAALFHRLADAPPADPESVLQTAAYFAFRGDQARAQSILQGLDTLTLQPGFKDLTLARFAVAAGDPDGATAHFESALGAAPRSADVWRSYFGFAVARADLPGAVAIARRAKAAAPADPAITDLAARADLIESMQNDPELRSLVVALELDPDRADAAQVMRAANQLKNSGQLESPNALRTLADQHPTSLGAQLFAASRLASLPSPESDLAAQIAMRAATAFPADPAAPRLAAEIYMRQQRWDEMFAAATTWRQRDQTRPVDADLALAQASLRLGRPAQALQILSPYLAAAGAAPDSGRWQGVLNIAARAMIAAGRTADARALLEPSISAVPAVRINIWLDAAAKDIPEYAQATAWIDAARRAIPADAPHEHLAVAAAMTTLAARFPDHAPELFDAAASVLGGLTDSQASTNAAAFEALGIIRHSQGNLGAAEAAYRTAISSDPARAASLNNLANIVMDRPGGTAEALGLAERAVQAAGASPDPSHLDTLGWLQLDAGDAQAAARSFRAALARRPAMTSAIVGLAQALTAGSQSDRREARTLLRRLDDQAAAGQRLPPSLAPRVDALRASLASGAP